MSEWSVARPKPGPAGANAGQAPPAAVIPDEIRAEITELMGRVEDGPEIPTEIFESAHNVLLRALGTVDRA